jgi:hypothetical protein
MFRMEGKQLSWSIVSRGRQPQRVLTLRHERLQLTLQELARPCEVSMTRRTMHHPAGGLGSDTCPGLAEAEKLG